MKNQGLALSMLLALACNDAAPSETAITRQALTGLVAAWSFDQGSGTTAPDASGNGHTGTLVGNTAWTAAGKYCGALTFDGNNDRVTTPDAADLDLNAAFTLLAWVRPTNLSNWRTVMLKEHGSALSYALYAAEGAQKPSGWIRVGSSDVDVTGSGVLVANTWAHLAFVRSAGATMTLYKDGVQVGTRSQSGNISASSGVLSIGGNAIWGEWFAGQIDEVRVYGRALSVSEIQSERDTPVDANCGGGGGSGGAGGNGGAGAGSGGAGAGSGGSAGAGAGSGGSDSGAGGQAGAGAGAGGTTGGAGMAGAGQSGSGGSSSGTGGTGGGSALTINQAQKFQVIDGFGVSANSASWNGDELKPALDLLVDGGSNIFRVVVEMTDWETTNDNADAQSINWCSFTPIYEGPQFQKLWSTIAYLNSKGIRERVMIDMMGIVPTWMGGSTLGASMLDEWVETVATVVWYGRAKKGLAFGMLSPLNEVDWEFEGPSMNATNFGNAWLKLVKKLDELGLGDLRLVGPDMASISQGTGEFGFLLLEQPSVLHKLRAWGLHNYEGTTGNARQILDSNGYPFMPFWMTELSQFDDAVNAVAQNAGAVIMWDGYDSVYEHAVLAGRGTNPPNDAGDAPALLAYSTSTGLYTPRPEYYRYAQLYKWVEPGSNRIGVSESVGSLTSLAFKSAATGRLTIFLRNTGSSVTLAGTGASGYSEFGQWRTGGGDNLAQQSNVTVSAGAFSVTVPSGAIVTLSGLPDGACP